MSVSETTSVPVRLRLRQKVANISEGFYEDAAAFGARMQSAGLKIDQVRSLESVAYSSDKVSDILDLVKRQVGRRRWSVELGEDLLKALDDRKQQAKRIANDVDRSDSDLPRRAHLLLCREFVKHLAAQFVYETRLSGKEDEE